MLRKISEKLSDVLSPKNDLKMEGSDDEFIEIEPVNSSAQNQLTVRYYTLNDFDDVKSILSDLREGFTVAFIKIKPLKDKNLNELRRAVDKVKKTCFALEGEVVGLEQDWIVAAPSYVNIHRGS